MPILSVDALPSRPQIIGPAVSFHTEFMEAICLAHVAQTAHIKVQSKTRLAAIEG